MTEWNDPNGCYMDKWQNEVYPTDKAIKVARTITSIENDIDHAIAALRTGIDQVRKDMPVADEWTEWRTVHALLMCEALATLDKLSKLSEDYTDEVMWKMVQRDDWFETRDDDASY